MRLIDDLESRHLMAERAAVLRDYKAASASLEKIASDKTAGAMAEAAEHALAFLKRPFTKTPEELYLATARGKELSVLRQLLDTIPTDVGKLREGLLHIPDELQKVTERTISHPGGAVEKVVERSVPPGTKSPVMQHVEQVQKIRQGLEKSDSKMPFRSAMLLLMGNAATGAGIAAGEKFFSDKVHKENAEMIAGDSQIPASLRARAKEMYGILVRYAPSIAKDQVFAKDFTKNLIRHDTVDHKIVQDLTNMEKTYREAKGRKAEFLDAIGNMSLKATGWF